MILIHLGAMETAVTAYPGVKVTTRRGGKDARFRLAPVVSRQGLVGRHSAVHGGTFYYKVNESFWGDARKN